MIEDGKRQVFVFQATKQPRRLLPRAQAAMRLGCSISSLRKFERARRLTAVRPGLRNVMYLSDEVDALREALITERSGAACESPVPDNS
jgi:hypothetical protein